MLRRVYFDQPLHVGTVVLDANQSHHLQHVLRLGVGDRVELFNPAGQVADGRIARLSEPVKIIIEAVREPSPTASIVIASAIPKGDRADWMIEKLSEIGVSRFVPLATERSVVLPGGPAKFDRWRRIANESAKQSRRTGVMTIDPLTRLGDIWARAANAIYLSTAADAAPLSKILSPNAQMLRSCRHLLIGPEGGWSEAELLNFRERGLTGAQLTTTILRVETAAIAAAVIAATLL